MKPKVVAEEKKQGEEGEESGDEEDDGEEVKEGDAKKKKKRSKLVTRDKGRFRASQEEECRGCWVDSWSHICST